MSITDLFGFLTRARKELPPPPYCVASYVRHDFRGEPVCKRGCGASNPYLEAEVTA